VLHALHRAPDEDGRAPRDREQEEEEGQQGWRRRLNDRSVKLGNDAEPPSAFGFLLLAAVTHFGGELTDLGWANDGFAWEEMEIGNSDQRISLGV
jgi:hypothetical protein